MLKPHPLTLTLLAALSAGCAGYNHTLFMTKSNAGLDIDTKPPTAEIAISRKEAVIAPAFEKGGTPPVMASFKPEIGAGAGFKNYFMGVDQTFAGGDAAKAMATLYDSEIAPDPGLYDSALALSVSPNGKGVLQSMIKPGEVKPFIFGTDTSLGLKAAWSGVGGQFPDSVKLGFNRKEFAWAPLASYSNGATHFVKMPSFLATIESNSGVDTNKTGISSLQYFATGEAATSLAVQPSVRRAMLARLDPNQKKLSKKWQENLSERSGLTQVAVLNTLYDTIASDPKAAQLRSELDVLDAGKILPNNFQVFSPTNGNTSLVKSSIPRTGSRSEFDYYLIVCGKVDLSIKALKAAINDPNISVPLPAGTARGSYLAEELVNQVTVYSNLRQQLIAVDPFDLMTTYLASQNP